MSTFSIIHERNRAPQKVSSNAIFCSASAPHVKMFTPRAISQLPARAYSRHAAFSDSRRRWKSSSATTRCAAVRSWRFLRSIGTGELRSKTRHCRTTIITLSALLDKHRAIVCAHRSSRHRARFGDRYTSIEGERESWMRVVRRAGGDGLWDSNVRSHLRHRNFALCVTSDRFSKSPSSVSGKARAIPFIFCPWS